MMDTKVLLHFMVACVYSHALVQPLTKTSSACYSSGGDCGFHFLSCDPGQVISLRDMHYGYKDPYTYARNECSTILTDCAMFVHKTTCCKHDSHTGCLKPYYPRHQTHAKEICEGKRGCAFHAMYADGGCQNDPPLVFNDVSSYSVIRYACVNVTAGVSSPAPVTDTTKCDDCAGGVTLAGSNVNTTLTVKQTDGVLALAVGVSAGIVAGLILLLLAAVCCWFRFGRKSLPPVPHSSQTSRTGPITAAPSRGSSSTRTASSSLPSSLYSSVHFTDSLSSHPDSARSQRALRSAPRFSNLAYVGDEVLQGLRHPHQGQRYPSLGSVCVSDLPAAESARNVFFVASASKSDLPNAAAGLSESMLQTGRTQDRGSTEMTPSSACTAVRDVDVSSSRMNDPPVNHYENAGVRSGNAGMQINFPSLEASESSDFTERRGTLEEGKTSRGYAEIRNATYSIRLESQWYERTTTGDNHGESPSMDAVYAIPGKTRTKIHQYTTSTSRNERKQQKQWSSTLADTAGWTSREAIGQPSGPLCDPWTLSSSVQLKQASSYENETVDTFL